MDVETIIKTRRSVRVFSDKPVEKEKLEALGLAAIWAPTGGNAQPWHFIIITRKETIKLIKTISPGLLGDPQAVIAVLADKQYNVRKMGSIGETLALMDCSMAAENIMLRAWDLGLGSCAVRSFNQKALREVLAVPEHISVELLITLGYPGHEPAPPPRKEGVIQWEHFQGEV